MPLNGRKLLLIGEDDAQCRSMARALRMLCPVETRVPGACVTPPAMADVVVMAGVALRNVQDVRKAEAILQPFVNKKIPVLWLLDKPTHRDDLQARAVGASTVMPVNVPLRRLAEALRDMVRVLPEQRRSVKQAATEAAVQDVGFALAGLMNAAEGGRPVEARVADEAAALLLETVGTDGVEPWMNTVGIIHDPTYRHCLLMAGLMGAFVLTLGFDGADCRRLTRAAILHDVGKALVPVDIIDKPGPLTGAEMVAVRRHAILGYELLEAQRSHDPVTLAVARSHHEYLDGSGYPDGLQAAQISDPVRIATICDVFAALIEQRSYKPNLPADEAYALMEPMKGKLDPDLLLAFRSIFVSAYVFR